MEYLCLFLAIFAVTVAGGLLWQRVPLWLIRPKRPGITFSEVQGHEALKGFLQHRVQELLSDQVPASALTKSILLYGRGENSKKTLVRAMAGESGALSFYEVDCTALIANTEAEAAIKHVFHVAVKKQPALILLRDVDAVLSDDEILCYLKAAVRSLKDCPDARILVMGTASIPKYVAEAHLDFFSQQLEVEHPNLASREDVVSAWVNAGNQIEVPMSTICEELEGFTVSQIQSILSHAAFNAKRDKRSTISENDFVRALYYRDQVFDPSVRTEHMTVAAYHEAGHALVYEYNGFKVLRLSAIPTLSRNGFTRPFIETVRYRSKHDWFVLLASTLAGHAAEELIFGENGVSDGSIEDLKLAREIAVHYYESGFGDTFAGCVSDEEMDTLLQRAYAYAMSIIKHHRDHMEDLVTVLLQNGYISGSELRRTIFTDLHPVPSEIELEEFFGEDDFDPDTYMID